MYEKVGTYQGMCYQGDSAMANVLAVGNHVGMSNVTAIVEEKPLVSSAKVINAQHQTLHLVNNDASNHGELPHSYFPCLDSRSGASNTWQASELPLKDVNLLRAICQRNGISPSSFIQAAWALVLQCYVGDLNVCFAFSFVGGTWTFPS